MKKTKFLIFCSLFSLFVSTKDYVINPGPDAYENLQEAMILMNAGDSILITLAPKSDIIVAAAGPAI